MLGRLADACQLELVDLVIIIDVIQRKGESRLQRRRRRHARSEGHVTREGRIEALNLTAALLDLACHAEDITCPRCCGFVLLAQAELGIVIQIDGIGADFVRTVGAYLSYDALVDGTREYESAIVVGMLSYKVYTTRRCVNVAFGSKLLGKLLSYQFDVHRSKFFGLLFD